ncbi:ATP-grasp domain-containing protein, partial [Burkholderia contaminans]|uniref:ATP-grasp domain-containing protein n=1 Tax=Burkholderia contaminans TaxID=488447 RepID=UPI0015822833
SSCSSSSPKTNFTRLRLALFVGSRSNAIPDRTIIENAIQRLTATLGTPAGYVIDFGVLDSGETALIEMNDGFSFGAYAGVSPEVYWAVTVSRWAELVARDPELQ